MGGLVRSRDDKNAPAWSAYHEWSCDRGIDDRDICVHPMAKVCDLPRAPAVEVMPYMNDLGVAGIVVLEDRDVGRPRKSTSIPVWLMSPEPNGAVASASGISG